MDKEILKVISNRYSEAFKRLMHSINQLNDEQIWHRPSSASNSIGIIVRHLNGNLNQWICSAVGGEDFQRNRPGEFEEKNVLPQSAILQIVEDLAKKVQTVIEKVPPDSLLSYRRIQGFDETIISALIAALTHLDLHVGQITFITKLILDQNYKAYWQPANKEQGK